MGSNLFPKELLEKGDFAGLTAKVKELMATINKVKN
jgi:2-dehydro-3-deoxyphosphogluconate aldolase/(4S)-4-hydroxy-2-oxoglutarate aldolase